ncbi:hypothetical protein LTR95_005677 [Oleoguttula sp. CCFEE 5521]
MDAKREAKEKQTDTASAAVALIEGKPAPRKTIAALAHLNLKDFHAKLAHARTIHAGVKHVTHVSTRAKKSSTTYSNRFAVLDDANTNDTSEHAAITINV